MQNEIEVFAKYSKPFGKRRTDRYFRKPLNIPILNLKGILNRLFKTKSQNKKNVSNK